MTAIQLTAACLLLVGLTSAQKPKNTEATGKQQGTAQKAAGPAAKPDAQGKGGPKDEVPAKVDPSAQLKVALQNAKAEARFLEEIQKQGGLLSRFKRQRAIAKELIQTFNPATLGPALPVKKLQSRLMGDAERGTMSKDVIFLVGKLAIRQPAFDAMVKYLESAPDETATTSVQTRAITAMVRAHAGEATFGPSAAKALDGIQEIANRLSKGGSFSDLAKALSDDQETKENGGKRAYLARKDLDTNYAKAAFALQVGQVSKVVRTAQGYHLIRVLAKSKGATRGEDRVLTSHILKRMAPSEDGQLQLIDNLNQGRIDVAFRTDALRKSCPSTFK